MPGQTDGRVAHAFDQPPVAAHTMALTGTPVACPSCPVGTSAQAICASVLTSPLLCCSRSVQKQSGGYQSDRENKVSRHGRTSLKRRPLRTLTPRPSQIQQGQRKCDGARCLMTAQGATAGSSVEKQKKMFENARLASWFSRRDPWLIDQRRPGDGSL
jgi:hypothetical protein